MPLTTINLVYDMLQYDTALQGVQEMFAKKYPAVHIITSRVNPDSNERIDATLAIQAPSGFVKAKGLRFWISHGISCTKGWNAPEASQVYLSPGPYWTEELLRRKYRGIVAETGWPKTDLLRAYCGNGARLRERRKLKIPDDVPFIVYFPTWSGAKHGIRHWTIEEILDKTRGMGKIGVVLHQMEERGYRKKLEAAKDVFLVPSNCTWKHSILAASDLLISDTSSVVYEYTIFDRPIVLLDKPGFPDYLRLGQNPNEPELTVGDKAVLETLPEILRKNLADPGAHREERRYWRENVLGKTDGRCCERVCDTIMNMLH